MNQAHLDILQQGVEAWNQWRKDNPNIIPDLSGADLWKAVSWVNNFKGADLRRADLRDADLRRADLRQASLRCTDLRRADLRGANLWKVDFLGAIL